MHEVAAAPLVATEDNSLPLWLARFDGKGWADLDQMGKLRRTATVSAALAAGAPGCSEVAIDFILFVQSQIELLRQFQRFNKEPNQVPTIPLDFFVKLRLEWAADILALRRFSEEVHRKAPGSRLDREITASISCTANMLAAAGTTVDRLTT